MAQTFELIGECKGNDGNGCFMDNSAHSCGCFVKKPKQQTTTYEKLGQLLILCNEIIEDILARRVVATDLLEVSENHGLECLSTHIPDEDRINNIKKELKKLDDSINNKL